MYVFSVTNRYFEHLLYLGLTVVRALYQGIFARCHSHSKRTVCFLYEITHLKKNSKQNYWLTNYVPIKGLFQPL